jgi:ribosomal protein L7/L12
MSNLTLTEKQFDQLEDLNNQNLALALVKELKETTGIGLKESKEIYDSMYRLKFSEEHKNYRRKYFNLIPKDFSEVGDADKESLKILFNKIDSSDYEAVESLKVFYMRGEKLAFLKLLKEINGWSLKDCKEYVDLVFPSLRLGAIEFKDLLKESMKFPVHCIVDGKVGYVQKTFDHKLNFFFNNDSFTPDYREIIQEEFDYADTISD